MPTGRFPDRGPIVSAIESARMAIRDAGIPKDEIDTVMPTAALVNPQFNTELVTGRIAEELGLRIRHNVQAFSGGATSASMLKIASGLILAGTAECILCVQADAFASGLTGQQAIDLFSTILGTEIP